MTVLLAMALLAAAAETPTANGDRIGVATRDANGHLTLQLRSVQCDGMVAEGRTMLAPADATYAATLKWLGGIRPGETKPVYARDLQPCPEAQRRR